MGNPTQTLQDEGLSLICGERQPLAVHSFSLQGCSKNPEYFFITQYIQATRKQAFSLNIKLSARKNNLEDLMLKKRKTRGAEVKSGSAGGMFAPKLS